MKLRLLVDTCVWLDTAKDYQQLPVLDALRVMQEAGELELILPKIVVAEFGRNKERVISESKKSLSSHFKLVREAMHKFAGDEDRDATLKQLNEVDHRIAVGGEAINDAIEIIEKLFANSDQLDLVDAVKARAADRAIAGLAPFHRQRNGISDAILIETYRDALVQRDPTDVLAFITHNHHDFSMAGGDRRLPHPDLADLFDDSRSRYSTLLGPLVAEYAGELLEEVRFDREFMQEPRRLSELLEAEHRLSKQVWYNRHWNLRHSVESGKTKIVTGEEWQKASPKRRRSMITDGTWKIALEAAKRTEDELGPDNIGPWTDFDWGMLNGKLSALRWMLGDEWDMLDT